MDQSAPLATLMNATEELLAGIADQHGPEIDELRRRLQSGIRAARQGDSSGERPRVSARDVAGSVNEYVRRYPWLALATGVLLASSLGILATSATRRSLVR